uniref:Uncharacterized protein n=1 Tax=Oryza punctata TaxID=4537 RepID=A0A0E0MF53_ORYPU
MVPMFGTPKKISTAEPHGRRDQEIFLDFGLIRSTHPTPRSRPFHHHLVLGPLTQIPCHHQPLALTPLAQILSSVVWRGIQDYGEDDKVTFTIAATAGAGADDAGAQFPLHLGAQPHPAALQLIQNVGNLPLSNTKGGLTRGLLDLCPPSLTATAMATAGDMADSPFACSTRACSDSASSAPGSSSLGPSQSKEEFPETAEELTGRDGGAATGDAAAQRNAERG